MKILTIGGGTGAPPIIHSLIQAKHTDITAICPATDSGGRTGLVRTDERDRVISIGDLFNTLLSLIPEKELEKKHLKAFFELASFTDGRKRNLGYSLYYGLLEKYQDHTKVQEHLEQLLQIKFHGQVLPVTTESTHLCFQTESGQTECGEHQLDYFQMSQDMVTKVWIDPEVSASKEVLTHIKESDYIIYCPGSLYGSIITNFLPKGITAALKETKAHKILITNLVTDRNQTHGFTPEKYFKTFQNHTKLKKPFDTIISPDITQTEFKAKFPETTASYQLEHSYFLGWEPHLYEPLKEHKVEVIQAPIYAVTPQLNRIRHDPQELTKVWKKLLK